jgi:hypothetical protein
MLPSTQLHLDTLPYRPASLKDKETIDRLITRAFEYLGPMKVNDKEMPGSEDSWVYLCLYMLDHSNITDYQVRLNSNKSWELVRGKDFTCFNPDGTRYGSG